MAHSPSTLSLIALAGVPLISAGDDLARVITDGLAASAESLQPGDIVVLAQKIVSKAEGRMVDLASVTPSARAHELAKSCDKDPRLVELILAESGEILRVRPGVIVVVHRLGVVMANAGIDQSNVDTALAEHVLLLPRDPDASCKSVRETLRARTGVDVGVMIIDSIGRAWRTGTVGTAIGLSGCPGLLDLRGKPDLFDRPLRTSELGVGDEIAAAASLLMGQADEGRPVVIARGVPYPLRDGKAGELIRPLGLDLFR